MMKAMITCVLAAMSIFFVGSTLPTNSLGSELPPETHHIFTNGVLIPARYLLAFEVAYSDFQKMRDIPAYQQDLNHYRMVIGEGRWQGKKMLIVSFELLGASTCNAPHYPNGFPGVDYYVRYDDLKLIGRNFASIWCTSPPK